MTVNEKVARRKLSLLELEPERTTYSQSTLSQPPRMMVLPQ